jgi:DNA-binding NtrC family response regulator
MMAIEPQGINEGGQVGEPGDQAGKKSSDQILVIGDSIGELIKKILIRGDYQVTVLRAYARFDLVYEALKKGCYRAILITNNTMGPDQISRMVPIISNYYPGVRIMVLSGYNNDKLIQGWEKSGADCFMPMPFECEDLKEKLRKLLE